jgi:hypothetical protein
LLANADDTQSCAVSARAVMFISTVCGRSEWFAEADGTRLGRKPKLTKHQAREALNRVAAGELLREIALSYNRSG